MMTTRTEAEVKTLLKSRGILTTQFALPRREELSVIDISYPLAVKVSSASVFHKTDVGGVFLNVSTPEELMARYDELMARFPGSQVLVEHMEEKGPEVIVGIVRDKEFGQCIMLGLGGLMADLLKEASFRRIPISVLDAEEMIEETKASAYFEGFRGFKADREAMVDLLLQVSQLGMEEQGLEQLDLNPVILREKGYVVVDAKMVVV